MMSLLLKEAKGQCTWALPLYVFAVTIIAWMYNYFKIKKVGFCLGGCLFEEKVSLCSSS